MQGDRVAVRAVVQRVARAEVSVSGEVLGQIGAGFCIFVGIAREDRESHAEALADKVRKLRVFEDDQGKMNDSICDRRGEVLIVSQFTLYADCRKGNRPSFTEAAAPERAEPLYRHFIERLRAAGLRVATGQFQAHMRVTLVNDGPVTLILDN